MKISRVDHSLNIYLVLFVLLTIYSSADSISNGPNRYAPIKRGYPPPPPPPPVKIHYGPKPPTQIYVNKGPNEHLLFPPNRGSIIRSHLSGPPHGPLPNHILHSSPQSAPLPPHSFQLKGPPPPPTHHLNNHGPVHGINLHHVPLNHGPQTFNIPGPPQPPTPPPPPTPPTPPKGPPQHFHNQGPPREFIVQQHRPPPSLSTIAPHKIQSSWKTGPTSFKAPAVKESFHASPATTFQSTSQFIRDDGDKGPIHTIPAPNLSLADKNQHHIKQQIQQQHLKQIEEQQHLKHVHEQQEHLKHLKEQQEHLKHIQQQEHLKHVQQQEQLKHIQEQQNHLKHIHEQQNQFNQIQEQQHQYSHIHEQQHHVKHVPEHVNHYQPHHVQEQQLHHQHHHHQKMKIPQPSRPLHTDHTPVVTTHLKIDPLTTYRVMEDQTAHKPGEPSYFAPDPDPSIKPPRVPPTNDPFSFPSNGQLPLDLIVQQHNEKQAEQLQHLSSQDHSGTMTAQDLFNIFNTINSQQQQQLEVIPPSAVDQHLNNHDLYESDQHQEIQHEPQNFHPQYETFNYDERTQQSAYGSDSYPVGSTNYEYKRAVEKHTGVQTKPGQVISPVRPNQNSIHMTMSKSNKPQKVISSGDSVDNQVDYEDQEEREIVTTKNHPVYRPTTLPSRETAQTLAHLAASGMKSSVKNGYNHGEETVEEEEEEEEGGEEQEEDGGERGVTMNHNSPSPQYNNKEEKSVSSSSNEGNVQVQKSVQIYETSYYDKPISQHKNTKQERHHQEYEDEYAQEQDDDMEDGESQTMDNDGNTKLHTLSQSMSFGERITPKRN